MSTQPQRKVPSPADINRQQGFEPPRSKVEATSSAVVAKAAAPATGTKATVPATTVQAPPPALPDTRTPNKRSSTRGRRPPCSTAAYLSTTTRCRGTF
jgi:hypothetical protein